MDHSKCSFGVDEYAHIHKPTNLFKKKEKMKKEKKNQKEK